MKKIMAVLVILLVLLAGCGGLDKNTVATVNGEPITKSEFNLLLNKMKVVYTAKGMPIEEAQLKEQVLNSLIQDKIVSQAAKKEGVDVPMKEAEKILEKAKQNFTNEQQWKSLLDSRHLQENDLVDYYHKQMVTQALVKKIGDEEKFAKYIEGLRMNAKIEKNKI